MNAEDPLFIPSIPPAHSANRKAYCIPPVAIWSYAATTFKYVFDYHPGDIYRCTADGLGHRSQLSAVRPAACGATTLMFEGVPTGQPRRDVPWSISTSQHSGTPRQRRSVR
ncbi:hypothetical protein KIF59_09035 [Enterobacter cloacae subsp. cloacae]|nr:hypothetical protein [Enterobacter cloacae subsp. cloacae]